MRTDNNEVIFAIVNSGFAEDVMDVAREQGVRGGTILNARGVVNEDAAAFFGITLHADKEILMMVVEKDIRDRVLNAIYKEMGMAKKAAASSLTTPRAFRIVPPRTPCSRATSITSSAKPELTMAKITS